MKNGQFFMNKWTKVNGNYNNFNQDLFNQDDLIGRNLQTLNNEIKHFLSEVIGNKYPMMFNIKRVDSCYKLTTKLDTEARTDSNWVKVLCDTELNALNENYLNEMVKLSKRIINNLYDGNINKLHLSKDIRWHIEPFLLFNIEYKDESSSKLRNDFSKWIKEEYPNIPIFSFIGNRENVKNIKSRLDEYFSNKNIDVLHSIYQIQIIYLAISLCGLHHLWEEKEVLNQNNNFVILYVNDENNQPNVSGDEYGNFIYSPLENPKFLLGSISGNYESALNHWYKYLVISDYILNNKNSFSEEITIKNIRQVLTTIYNNYGENLYGINMDFIKQNNHKDFKLIDIVNDTLTNKALLIKNNYDFLSVYKTPNFIKPNDLTFQAMVSRISELFSKNSSNKIDNVNGLFNKILAHDIKILLSNNVEVASKNLFELETHMVSTVNNLLNLNELIRINPTFNMDIMLNEIITVINSGNYDNIFIFPKVDLIIQDANKYMCHIMNMKFQLNNELITNEKIDNELELFKKNEDIKKTEKQLYKPNKKLVNINDLSSILIEKEIDSIRKFIRGNSFSKQTEMR